MLRLALLLLFGDPRLAHALHILSAITRLCPCGPADDACVLLHQRSAAAIAVVAAEQPDPERATALLVGAGTHETCFRTEHQILGYRRDGTIIEGPAITVFQLEVRPAERLALLADPVRAARIALRAARGCGGSMVGYAWGRCDGADAAHLRAAAGLRTSVQAAWWALAQP